MKEIKRFCPICKKETRWDDNSLRPFCSERCRLVDLGKWAAEDYRISGEKQETPAESKVQENETETG